MTGMINVARILIPNSNFNFYFSRPNATSCPNS